MKRTLQIALLITCLAVCLTCAYMVWSTERRCDEYNAGYDDGVLHAIEDSVIWTVDVYNPNDPESSAWGEYDQLIYIDLDGETYMHGMYQG